MIVHFHWSKYCDHLDADDNKKRVYHFVIDLDETIKTPPIVSVRYKSI